MPDWTTLTSEPAVQVVGWTLLHFVWQGALMAGLLAGTLRLLRDHAPSVRYAASCIALAGLLAFPVGTAALLTETGARAPQNAEKLQASGDAVLVSERRAVPPMEGNRSVSAKEADASAAGASPAAWTRTAADTLRPALPGVVVGWLLGVVVFGVRLAGGAWQVRRLRRSGTPAPETWRQRLDALAERVGVERPVRLRQSDRADGPMLVGWWRPVVLVPTGLLSGLPPQQVEALLVHELAHIRRHDVLVGRLQAMVEALLFFHPATWWVSKQVRRTREACCDDLTVRAGTQRGVYARALATLAERVTAGPTAWTPAAGDGALLTRIRRLLNPEPMPSRQVRQLSIAVATILLVGVPMLIAACASSSTSAPDAPEASPVATSPGAPAAPAADTAAARPSAPAASPPSPPDAPEPRVVVADSSAKGWSIVVRGDTVFTLRGDSNRSSGPGIMAFELEGNALDSLRVRARRGLLQADSLRVRMERLRPDVERMRRWADSLRARWADGVRTSDDSLRARLQRMNDSLWTRFRQTKDWADRVRVIGDSTLTIITPDDTLTHRLPLDSMPDFGGTAFSVAPDSLLRQFRLDRERLDRMGEEAQEMVKRMKQEEAERLREQARRLLEQAERLEERARRMREQEDRRQEQEGAPAPDTSAASDRGALWGRLTGRLDRGTPPVRWRVVPREEARPQSAALWVRIADGPRLVGYPSGHRSRAERAARPAIRLLETARYVKTVRHVRSAGQVQAQTARLTGLEPSGYALRVVQVVPSSAQIVSSTPQRSAQHQAWRTMVL